MPLYTGLLGTTQSAVGRTSIPNSHTWRAHVAIGAAGAATVTTLADAVGGTITCVKNTTGIYDITYPILAAVATSVPVIKCDILQSAAVTVAKAYFKAFAPTAGTAQVVTFLNTAGTPVEPASGDSFYIEVTAVSLLA